MVYSHVLDDYGWKVCQQYLGFAEKCDTGNSEKEQQWIEFWGTLQKCIHYGSTQTWREAVHRPQRCCDRTLSVKGILHLYRQKKKKTEENEL